MRNSGLARALFLFLACSIPTLLPAQFEGQFQTPTPEELKMTVDPRAPGAAAVYLNVEETTNDELHYKTVYARIKVLEEKGKELATVQVGYLKEGWSVSDIKARTIHSDGTIVPLEGKPDELLIAKTGNFEVDRKVFNLPSVEVGSILEYRYRVRYDDRAVSSPAWEIQRRYFVHKAHYSFTPFRSFRAARAGYGNYAREGFVSSGKDGRTLSQLVWWSLLPKDAAVQSEKDGSFILDVSDIPAAPREDWMPPVQSYLQQLEFFYAFTRDPQEFWAYETKEWSKEVDHFAEVSGPIREAVKGLTAPGDSDLDKAKKLYKAVQALDNTGFSRTKGKTEMKELNLKAAKRAEDTWSQKSGSKREIALLYLAMLRAAGLNASAMRVVDREKGVFNPNHLETRQLDDDLVVLSTGGKEIYLDPGEKMCPFQFVHWRHAGASGIRQGGAASVFATSPLLTYADNTAVRLGDLTLDEQGGVNGTLRFAMTGQRALDLRQEALRNDLDEVKKSFDRQLESLLPTGVAAHVDRFAGLDDPDAQLLATVKVQGVLGTATAKRTMLPGFFFETHANHPFVEQENRQVAVDMRYPQKISEEMVYHLPAGMSVEAVPQETKIPWPDHALFSTRSASAPGKVTVSRIFSRGFTTLVPGEYKELRGFYQKVAASDRQQLVLTRASAANGN